MRADGAELSRAGRRLRAYPEFVAPALLLMVVVLVAFGALSLVVGTFGVYSTVRMRTEKQVREIGIRRAVGATRRAILTHYLRGALRLALPAAVVGLWLALFVRAYLPALPPLPPTWIAPTVLAAALPVLGAVVVGATRPAWRAARLAPAATLRKDG